MKKQMLICVLTLLAAAVSNALAWDGGGDPNDPYLIYDANDLNAINSAPDKCFKLMDDIDLASNTYSTAVISPEGSPAFTGTFDGNDHTISNLTIDTLGAGNDYLGLFGNIVGAEIKDLGLVNVNITGSDDSDYIGGLAGYYSQGQISNCYVTGTVSAGNNSDYIGGLIGYLMSIDFLSTYAIVDNCYADVNVTTGETSYCVGGLVGYTEFSYISNSHVMGDVTAGGDSEYTGGLVGLAGMNFALRGIIDSYATGDVTGDWYVGGFAGGNSDSIIRCYATGAVYVGYRPRYPGGLIGTNYHTISDCYAKGPVTSVGDSYVGGLVGDNTGDIYYCYATGVVNSEENMGGLVGSNTSGSINDCFWDVETSFTSKMCGGGTGCDDGDGKTTMQMKHHIIFDPPWDFAGTWNIVDHQTYPYFQWQPGLCGDQTHPYPVGDITQNCVVDMLDFAEMASHWLDDNRP